MGLSFAMPIEAEENPIFLVQNSNKKLVSLNLKSEEGKEAMLKLLEEADVFISNVRYRSLQKMGLAYDDVKERCPQLVYYHFTGYGNQGELASRPGFDAAAFWARNGAPNDWMHEGMYPVSPTCAFGDTVCSLSNLAGVMSALYARARDGHGSFVTTSLLGNGIWCNNNGVVGTQNDYKMSFVNTEETAGPFAAYYRCKDQKWIMICVLDAWRGSLPKMVKLFDLQPILDANEEAVKTNPNSLNRMLRQHISKLFIQHDSEEWCKRFDEADIVYEVAARIGDIQNDKQAWDNGYLTNVALPSGKNLVVPNYPVSFGGYEVKPAANVGGIGSSTAEVLKAKGYTDEQIAAMAESKAIRI